MSETNNRATKKWQALCIVGVLAINYATILRTEIFAEMRTGASVVEAVTQGDLPLTIFGILVSVVGFAWLLHLLFGKTK